MDYRFNLTKLWRVLAAGLRPEARAPGLGVASYGRRRRNRLRRGRDLSEGQCGITASGLRTGSTLAHNRLFEVTSSEELILAGGTGNGYRLTEMMSATNPSGWSGVLK